MSLSNQVNQAGYERPRDRLVDIAPDFIWLGIEFSYGDVLSRSGLNLKLRLYYLAPGTIQLQTWAADKRFRDERIGLGSIARRADGILIVGHYSNGTLFQVMPQPHAQPTVTTIPLERQLENPDGMQFAPDGSLIQHLPLRTRIKRLARKTICFSKSIWLHDVVIGLFINRYEFGVDV